MTPYDRKKKRATKKRAATKKKEEPKKLARKARAILRKRAVIITGNPKFIGTKEARAFYARIRAELEKLGYEVVVDAGKPQTSPPKAALWVGHSRGADRLRFAPKGTSVVALGVRGGLNHPKDASGKLKGPPPKGFQPNSFHYVLTGEMKRALAGVDSTKPAATKRKPTATKQKLAAKKRPTAKKRPAAKLKKPLTRIEKVRKARLANEKRNAARRKVRAEARRKELARLARLERARKARERARKRVKGVNTKQLKLRLEKEKLRLKEPKTTKRKVKEVRGEVNRAVEAPPVVVELTQSFDELFAIAKKKGELPHIDYRQRIMESERMTGRKRMVPIGKLITEDVVEQILYRVKQASSQLGGFKIWRACITISSLGPEIVGSGGRMLIANHPLAFKFQADAHDSTGVWSSERGMLATLETMLEKIASSEKDALVYLHAVLVEHFTRKS